MAFATGSHFGKYVLGRRLGQGGFGDVFAAHDASLDREVALKFLKPEHTRTPEIVKRFLQEARSAAKIVHPGIVTMYECGQIDGTHSDADGSAFIAMELLDGEALDARLARSGRLAAGNVIEIGRQLASALDAAHRAGIVHRDLKPENVFLVRDSAVGSGERAKVLDFGIAKLGDTASSSVRTQTSVVFGTPRYMSPEQCRSAASVDHRSDIYTLGCILFELLSGRPPFLGGSGELIAQHILVAPPEVRSFVPEVPPALAALIAQMLHKEPGDRPSGMAQVQRALESCGGFAPGVAVTMPPDARLAVTILPHHDTLPHVQTFPTTLSAFAGASVGMHRTERMSKRAKLATYAAAAAIAIAIPISYLGLRGSNATPLASQVPTPAAAPKLTLRVEPITPAPGLPHGTPPPAHYPDLAPAPAPAPVAQPVPEPIKQVVVAPAKPINKGKRPVAPKRVGARIDPPPPLVEPTPPKPEIAQPPPPAQPEVRPAPVPGKPRDSRDATINPFTGRPR
jgi:serine/threonine-protein kinase